MEDIIFIFFSITIFIVIFIIFLAFFVLSSNVFIFVFFIVVIPIFVVIFIIFIAIFILSSIVFIVFPKTLSLSHLLLVHIGLTKKLNLNPSYVEKASPSFC